MEQEQESNLDLGRYVASLRKWYRLILLATVLAAVAALIVSFATPPTYEAEAAVAIVKSGTQINFDTKIKTISEMDTAQLAADQTARRKSLTTIAKSTDVATGVIAKLGSRLEKGEQIPANLAGAIDATNDGDLIKIKVKANSADKAALLANTWAQEYERRVNAIYGESALAPDEIQTQADATKRDYDTKETALIAYLARNPIDQLSRQIAEKQQVVASLQTGKQTSVKTVVDKELESRTQIIAAYLAAQSNNRMLAFNKEQEEKTKLLSAYLDAEINSRLTAVNKDNEAKLAVFTAYVNNLIAARTAAIKKEQDAKVVLFNAYADVATTGQAAVINKQVEAKLANLSDAYAAQNKLERLLTEAKSLRERVRSGSASQSSATANSLAIVLLQASAFTTGANLPVGLQIPMNQLSDLNASPDQQARDLDVLIETLTAKLKETQLSIDTQTRALQSAQGYTLLPGSTPTDPALQQSVQQKYADLFKVGDLSKLSDTTPIDSELSKAILQKYNELFGVGELAKLASATPVTTTLSLVIQQKYPELFQTGDLAKLSDAVPSNNPLASAAEDKVKTLLGLEGLDKVVNYSTTDQPITQAINNLQAEINQLQGQLEQESAKKQELVRARDLAWTTYSTLSSKVAEVNVASQSKGTVVRLAVPAIAPESPVAPKKSLNTLLAALVGLMLGVGAAFLFEYLDDSVTSEDQVTRDLGLATIGAIPELLRASANGRGPVDYSAMVVVKDSRSAATEALRLLRHNLLTGRVLTKVTSVSGVEGSAARQVLMLASALPSEGKSTVAVNLAAMMARAGKPVILVDADFRRPSQHKFFGLKNDRGLYNILNDADDNWEAYAQTTEIEGLRVVTSGPLPQDPAALLDSPAMARWIERLKRGSDIVIVDTPAALGLADATIVARVVDGIVMVVGAGVVSRRDAARAKERLTETGIPILGVVLNRTDTLPGALTYEYYARRQETPPPSANGHGGWRALWQRGQTEWLPAARDRLVDLVGPRRHG